LGELVELELVVEVLLGVGRVEDFIELEVPLDQPLVSSFLFLHLTQLDSFVLDGKGGGGMALLLFLGEEGSLSDCHLDRLKFSKFFLGHQ